MARQLIDSLASTWNPHKYADQYATNLRRVIEAKGKRPQLHGEQMPRAGEVVDLMARLRASLEARKPADRHARRTRAHAASAKRKQTGRVA